MSLRLRHLKHAYAVRRAKPVAIDAPSRIQSKVGLTDQDVFGHMTNTRYNGLADVAVAAHLRRAGLFDRLKASGLRLRVVREDVVFHRSLKYPNHFAVETQAIGATGAAIGFEHVFLRGDRRMADVRSLALASDENGVVVDLKPFLAAPLQDLPAAFSGPPGAPRKNEKINLKARNIRFPLLVYLRVAWR